MSFASPVFLWYFMPAVLVLLWVAPHRARNVVVAGSSLLFYTWGAGSFVLVMLACVAVNFVLGRAMGEPVPGDVARDRQRRILLSLAVAVDLGVLVVWKYGEFGTRQAVTAAHAFGLDLGSVAHIALPIGISFFTFHHISYVVDVYRGIRPPQRDPLRFLTYIVMFPQLIAGPIVRYHEIADQLPANTARDRLDDFTAGFPRFAHGLFKKVVVADSIAPIADAVFALPDQDLTTPSAWLGALAYTLQIYFDFSGYSDMAIGLGRMLGFRLPENFNRPYSSVSITDFWRRWHMSLSRWFRDYLYIPLGGNRGTPARTYLNLYIVFFLTGLWHGANWTFVVWGLYHGSFLALERATGWRELADARLQVLRRAATFFVVLVGWVLFRASDLGQAGHILRAMFVPDISGFPAAVSTAANHQATVLLVLGAAIVLVPRGFVTGRYLDEARSRVSNVARVAIAGVGAPYAAILVAAGTFSPFLYYRF
jgi:alginate O-acetyltransferase complex protein AlgI